MKIKRQINQRTFQRFKKMVSVAALVFCVNYFSEKSMAGILDATSQNSNDEYDWSLPFVTAAGEESEFLYSPDAEGIVRDPEDSTKILYSTEKDNFKWQDKKYSNHWQKKMRMGYIDEFYDDQHCNS
jgi:hypothetical protein|tara:strand:+ start:97 stop:477 length:381 start_codon:yes stop_codon:yes gene_type:complete